MSQGRAEHETIVWTDPPRLPLVASVLGRMRHASVLAIGGPRKTGLTELAASHGGKVHDDLRQMIREHSSARSLLLATSEGVARADLQQARAAGMSVLAVEPPVVELAPVEGGGGFEGLVPAPWLRLSGSWLAAAEPQQALGVIRAMHLTECGPPEAGSLYARLYDALDMLVHLRGVPESIDAALITPLPAAPDDLRGLTGHLTAHLRYGSEASATLMVSDRAGAWHRRLVVFGSEGQLVLEDEGYRLALVHDKGRDLDSLRDQSGVVDPAELIARQWQRILDEPYTAPPADRMSVIACCQAALLSARTGEHESPRKLLHMSRG